MSDKILCRRKNNPWVILYFHTAFYNFPDRQKLKFFDKCNNFISKMFEKISVDLTRGQFSEYCLGYDMKERKVSDFEKRSSQTISNFENYVRDYSENNPRDYPVAVSLEEAFLWAINLINHVSRSGKTSFLFDQKNQEIYDTLNHVVYRQQNDITNQDSISFAEIIFQFLEEKSYIKRDYWNGTIFIM